MVFNHSSFAFDGNSLGYLESSGSRTWTNLGGNTNTGSGAVAQLSRRRRWSGSDEPRSRSGQQTGPSAG